MAIERLQPPADLPQNWRKTEPKPAAKPRTPASHQTGPAHFDAKAAVRHQGPDLSERLRAQKEMIETRNRLSDLDQSLIYTRQELAHAQQAQFVDGLNAADPSYWQKLDVAEKARAINRLKEEVQDLELKRGELVADLTEQVHSGTYSITGAEILAGMLDEIV